MKRVTFSSSFRDFYELLSHPRAAETPFLRKPLLYPSSIGRVGDVFVTIFSSLRPFSYLIIRDPFRMFYPLLFTIPCDEFSIFAKVVIGDSPSFFFLLSRMDFYLLSGHLSKRGFFLFSPVLF